MSPAPAKVLGLRRRWAFNSFAAQLTPWQRKGYKRKHHDRLLPELSHCCLLLLRVGVLWRT
jgi:hypothetical protein